MRIQERVQNAVLDFTTIFAHFDEEQYEAVFEDIDDRQNLETGVKNALAFLFQGTATPNIHRNMNIGDEENGPDKFYGAGRFDNLLELAYLHALVKHHDFLVEDFDHPTATGFQIDGVQTARELAEAGEDLSPKYIQLLLETGVIDTEAVQQTVRERVLEDIPPRSENDDEE